MKAVYCTLLLAALTGAASGLFQRKHIEENMDLSWPDAQAHCRTNFVDLSTIATAEDLEKFKTDTAEKSGKHWIGLQKDNNEAPFEKWSDGNLLGSPNWKGSSPENKTNELCVVSDNAELECSKCTDKNDFFCYIWEPQLVVVQEMKTWEEALEHCRTFYTHLISVTNDTDLFVISNKSLNINTPGVWTGLRFLDSSWFHVNEESLVEMVSLPAWPAPPFRCGAHITAAGVLENRDCEEKMNFICYNTTG